MRRRKPVGAILFRAGKGDAADVVYAVAKWHDSTGRQCYRRVGRAWVKPDGGGGWRRRRGRAPDGCVDRREAERLMDALIDETERDLITLAPNRGFAAPQQWESGRRRDERGIASRSGVWHCCVHLPPRWFLSAVPAWAADCRQASLG